MYVVGVNRKERSLAPVQKILNSIDTHYDHLHAHYENFHITSIQVSKTCPFYLCMYIRR